MQVWVALSALLQGLFVSTLVCMHESSTFSFRPFTLATKEHSWAQLRLGRAL